MVDLQRDGIVDPIIRESLFEIPGTDKIVLSAARLFRSAAKIFNGDETDDGNTRLEEQIPASLNHKSSMFFYEHRKMCQCF